MDPGQLANLIRCGLILIGLYAGAGLIFASLLHARGLSRLDPASRGAGLGFLLLITPGLVALWPYFAVRWSRVVRGGSPPPDPTALSPSGVRRAHGLFWKALVIAAPLAIGSGLYWRPQPVPSSRLPNLPNESPIGHAPSALRTPALPNP